MFNLASVQSALRDLGVDGWLMYDFRGLNVLARRILEMPTDQMLSRRWFYFVPAKGEPKKLVHKIEPKSLESYPGTTRVYLRWQELEAGVAELLQGSKRVAMEYVPRNANPYISRVDAGTVELVRSNGVEVVPSGDLVQLFEACWDDEQWAMHLEAAKHTRLGLRCGVRVHRRACEKERLGARNRGAAADHGPFRQPRLDDRSWADRRRWRSQRRPALCAWPGERLGD